MKKSLMLIIMMLFIAFDITASPKVIYGVDNRIDTVNSSNAMYRELAESTAAMIPNQNIAEQQDYILLGGSSLQRRGICKSERFSKQLTAANCSGFLIGEDILVTAGHCIRSTKDCAGYKWVFDYKVESEEQEWATVPKTSVYSCKKILRTVLNNRNQDDYAVLQLDRKVLDRRVLQIRTKGKPAINDPLVVIGHPSGLPQKIADGAKIRKLSGKYFTANLDTYGGNSGSAVFNAKTGLVEGILVRGETDYVYDRAQGCRVSNVVGQNSGRGEDVTFITNIDYLK